MPDAIIWRYNITYVPGVFNPKKIIPRVIFITEHQAKEIEELQGSRAGRLLAPLIAWNGNHVLRKVDGIIGVTSEIASYEYNLIRRDIPYFTLTNSIRVQNYPLKKSTRTANDLLRMLYVGSHTASWQGLDRILAGMSAFKDDTKLELHIAGILDADIAKLIESLHLRDRVIVHGYKTDRELDCLFDLCDLAIGTLGMHRKDLVYGSTLKVREYMARGIPFIISYKDEDIAQNFPYILHAPADDTPIDFSKVMAFIKGLRKYRAESISTAMRDYASEHMDYEAKAHRLLAFIKSLVPATGT